MWSSLPAALTALLLLSDSTSALNIKRVDSLNQIKSAVDAIESGSSSDKAPSKGVDSGDGAPEPLPVIVVNTITVIPVRASSVPGVFYPGIATGTGAPSGIFWPAYGSGSGFARPTGFDGRNGTRHRNQTTIDSASPTSSIPFFSLTNTALQTGPSLVIGFADTGSSTTDDGQQVSTTIVATTASTALSFTTAVPVEPPTANGTSNTTATNHIPFLRGVNLGGWLVLEKWMNPDAFTGAFSDTTDQFTFDSTPGAKSALEKHWSTFFTESDIQTIANTGINALRIPIGFWAYDNAGTPYIKGADAYLEKAIGWARKAGLKVWVDLHGSPGSQNGFDNSGHAGTVEWQTRSNLNRSISVLKVMAAKYGSLKYADVVVGLELVNEPISWGNNNINVTKAWAKSAYEAVKNEISNEKLVVVMHDAFEGATTWIDVAKSVSTRDERTFGIDSHLYQLFTDGDNNLTQSQHISAACGWGTQLSIANKVMPTYVGEFSPATNICVNPDGSTTAGTSCVVPGCQCQVADMATWNNATVGQLRRYVEAQLDVFEQNTSGYFMWSAKAPGAWGFLNGIKNGAIPNPVTSRKFPGQCRREQRRAARRSLEEVLGAVF